MSGSARPLAVFAILGASLFAFPASAATGICAPATAQGATGPADYVGYCWIDFAGYDDTLARGGSGQPLTITLDGGGTLSFNLRVTVSPTGTALEPKTAPSWSGAPLGASAFTGIPGRPVPVSGLRPHA